MKKNISINISGIIFYIEEDGYDKLKEYLDSINRYFAKFDDCGEIVSDIESRIAEIFLSKLKEGRQVILLEDVESLISTMGSIKDFKAVEEPEELFEEQQYTTDAGRSGEYKSKRLYRDVKRKAIGGVAAGMGHYFNIDPLWIRILFLVFFISFFFEFGISIAIAVIYVILWISIPGSDELSYDRKYKKMYRNPDDKVLGGVASGVAKYFGVDVVIVRLLFVVFIFIALSGLVAYIILWIILPEAKTITDKMEMEGEPVTLSNIEANIKRSFNVKEGEENILLKILLFPFRVIAVLIEAISKNLGPFLKILVDAVRIIAGVVFTMTGTFSLILLVILFGVIIGVFASGNLEFLKAIPMPVQVIKQTIPTIIYVSTFVFLLVPFLFLALLGLMIITKKNLIFPTVGWSLFTIWIASVFALSFTIPPIVANFAREGVREEVEHFKMEEGKLTVLQISKASLEGFEDFTKLTLRGHESPEFKLIKKFEAKGRNDHDAFENTKTVYYQVQHDDTVLIFDSNLRYHQDAVFRMQKMTATLYIPFNHRFTMDRNLSRILENTLRPAGYSSRELEGNTWEFTEEGLKCITCPDKKPATAKKSNAAYIMNNKIDMTI